MKRSRTTHPATNVLHLRAHRDWLGGGGVDFTAHGHMAIVALAGVISIFAAVVVLIALAK